MESNFSFLKERFGEYYKLAVEAERNLFAAPRTSVMYARLTLEELIKWMYTYDPTLIANQPEKQTLEGLMYHASFKELIAPVPDMLNGLTAIRRNGNQAIHNKNDVALRYAHNSLNNLFEFAKWIYYTYVDSSVKLPMSLDSSLIPRATGAEESIAAAKAMQSQLEKVKAETEKALLQKEDELERLRNEIAQIKVANEQKQVETFTLNPTTEAETRRVLIDVMLREAGWKLDQPKDTEYEVSGMPNKTGIGYVDYVLWGNDGQPLAVVEAKSALHAPHKGQHQAKLYADCLENRFRQRPIIFYTNGYETWIWDDRLYPPRKVAGFYTRDELEWTISKRNRKPLANAAITKEIAGRYYQEEALKRVSDVFDKKHRKALLVMATGTGKTRTAIALVDMVMKQGWARRILFLADRNALVIQAKNNFTKLLPNLSCADITKDKEKLDNRMIFSTYPTIVNKIDNEKINDMLVYSPAHFDLIIIDEAHRSIYRKYQMIFNYFDALLVGLTATPKSDVDKNTYEFFDLEDHNPTYSYELDKAVDDQFLVPPKKVSVTTHFMRDGIKYNELSDEEKLEYEEKFYDYQSDTMPEEIDSSDLNQFVFNKHTVDLVLNQLMTDGLKIEGGDKIGKSVIFAKNHQHAVFIQERFYKLYPHLGGDFIQVIDNYQDYAQSLIDNFSDVKKNPQIAVSVDMLDTGIDVPEILNLVFFKVVKSAVKFWQMIGRGTRLCPAIFGIPEDDNDKSKDKSEFLIFDYCGNFEFFDVNPDGFESKLPQSIAQRIMETRLRIAMAINRNPDLLNEENGALRDSLLDQLHQSVLKLNRNSFIVKAVLQEYDTFSVREKWNSLTDDDINTLFDKLTPLAEPESSDEDARRFDLLMLNLMLAALENSPGAIAYSDRVKSIANNLLKKTNLPIVKQKEPLLKTISTEEFWQETFSLRALENIRIQIRELVRLLDKEKRKIVYSDFKDEISDSSEPSEVIPTYVRSDNYKQRVERYVRENENHLTIQKLKKNVPITAAELTELERMLFDGETRGTKELFVQNYGEQPLGKFIRSIVGFDANAAKEAFADFLNAGNLSADQIRFVDMIIDYLSTNGVVDADMLFEEPFTTLHTEGVAGLFDDRSLNGLLTVLKRIDENAVAA